MENVQSALENNTFVCGIVIDLEKAFDTVDHNILLHKLNYYGIRGIANVTNLCKKASQKLHT